MKPVCVAPSGMALALLLVILCVPAFAGNLTTDPNPSAFGNVSVSSGPTQDSVVITNAGSTSQVSGFSLSAGCSEFSVQAATVLPVFLADDEALTVNVSYDPIDRNADSCEVTTITSGSGGEFTLQGDGTAASLNTLVTTLTFADQRWNGGTPEVLNITIENLGEESISESNLTVGLASGTHFFIGTPSGLPVAFGETATIPVTFDPLSMGSKSDTVTISINNDSALDPSDQVAVVGTGTEPVELVFKDGFEL